MPSRDLPLFGVCIAILIFWALACSSGAPPSRPPTHPLDQAELAFIGGHSRAEIKAAMDRALRLYDLPLTTDNYSRAGSTLVALRKQNGTPEMAILDYMVRSYVPGVTMTFPEAAALASVFLRVGDR